MYRLIVSELAHLDLDHILTYISVDLAAPSAAVNLLDEIEKCYSRLKDNPLIYEKCLDSRLERKGYRKAVVRHYVLVYKIDEALMTVSVLRFFYGAQDYARLI